MSDKVDTTQSGGNVWKQKYPDFVSKLENKGLSEKTIRKLIEDEEITSMPGLKHLGESTINAMTIPDTQKNILRELVEGLKPSGVARRGGIEARNCIMETGKVDGTAMMASIKGHKEGTGGIQMEDVKVKTGEIGKDGKVFTCEINKGDQK